MYMTSISYIFEEMKLTHKPNTFWLEFGVFTGNSINYISNFTTDTVYGFDSFEGLPEDWRPEYKQGAFNVNGIMPDVNYNVKLIKGLFNETLPVFIADNPKKISFVHVDCDLYSSTKCIFDNIGPYFDDDCIILFDEIFNYPGHEEHELKALNEFVDSTEWTYKILYSHGETAVVRLSKWRGSKKVQGGCGHGG